MLEQLLRQILTLDVLAMLRKPTGFAGWLAAVKSILVPVMDRFGGADQDELGDMLQKKDLVGPLPHEANRRATVKLEKNQEKEAVKSLARELVAGTAVLPPQPAHMVPNLDAFGIKYEEIRKGGKPEDISPGDFLVLLRALGVMCKDTPEHKTWKEAELSMKFKGHAYHVAYRMDKTENMEAGKKWCGPATPFRTPGCQHLKRSGFQRMYTEDVHGQWYARISTEIDRVFDNLEKDVATKREEAQNTMNLNVVAVSVQIGDGPKAIKALETLATATEHMKEEYWSLIVTGVWVALYFANPLKAAELILRILKDPRCEHAPDLILIAVIVLKSYLNPRVDWAACLPLNTVTTNWWFKSLQFLLDERGEGQTNLTEDDIWNIPPPEPDPNDRVICFDVIPHSWGLPEWSSDCTEAVDQALQQIWAEFPAL